MFGRVSSNLCWYSVRCLFSEYKSSYCLVGKESVYIYIYMCVCVCVCVYMCTRLLNRSLGRRVTVFVLLTPRWFLVKEAEFTFSSPSQKIRLLVFFRRLIMIGSVQSIYFCAGIRPPVGNKPNSLYNMTLNRLIVRLQS